MPAGSVKGSTGSPRKATTATRQASASSITGPGKNIMKNTRVNGEDPLVLLGKYLTGLVEFTNKTRNAHLEVKEGVKNAFKAFLTVQEKYAGAEVKLPPSSLEDGNKGQDSRSVDIKELLENMNERMVRTEMAIRELRTSANPQGKSSPPETPPQPGSDSEVTWAQVTRKKKTKKAPPVDKVETPPVGKLAHETGTATSKRKPNSNRPPAVLIKISEGRSYADTVTALRKSSGLKPEEMREQINRMKKTKRGDLLFELKKGAEIKSAQKLSSEISGKLGAAAAEVVPLRLMVDIEIVDIDAAADQVEVLEAIRAAIAGGNDDAAAQGEREAMQVTGLWATKSRRRHRRYVCWSWTDRGS